MNAPLFPSLDAGRSIRGRHVTFTIDDGSTVVGDVLDVVDNGYGPAFLLGTFGLPTAVGDYTIVPFARVTDYRYDSSFLGGFYVGVD